MGACSKGGLFEGALDIFLVVGRTPVETFLLINSFSTLHIQAVEYFLEDRHILINYWLLFLS